MQASASARERLEEYVTSFENPEITAMSAIARILDTVPDEAARLRIMRWAFAKYSEEFKRPALAPMTPVTPGAPARPLPAVQPVLAAPAAIADDALATEPADFDRQVAELNDLFGDRPDGLKLAKPRER